MMPAVAGGGGPSLPAADGDGSRGEAMAAIEPKPFTIAIDEAILADLRARIRATRWPTPAPGEPWSQGTDRAWLERLPRPGRRSSTGGRASGS